MAKRQEVFSGSSLPVVEPPEVVPPFCRSAFNYDRDKVSDETGLACADPSLTLQDQAQDADINIIVKRYIQTGQVPQGVRVPTYGDFDAVGDYRSALELVEQAQDAFLKLPPAIRSRFDNDPGAFLAFCDDPANLPELRKMGLALPEAAPTAGGSGEPAQADLVEAAKKPV